MKVKRNGGRKEGMNKGRGGKKGGMEKEGTVITHEGQFDPGRQHKV